MAIVVLSSFALLLIGVFVIAYCGLNGAQITLFSALHKDVSAALTAVFEEKKLAARVLAIDFLVRNYDKQSTDYENFFKAIYPYSMTWHNASAMYFCGANGYITAVDHRPFGVRHVLSSSPPDLVYKRYTINTNTSTCPSCDYLKLDYVTNIRNKLNATERPYFIAGRSAPPEGKWTPIYVSSSRGMYVLPFVVPIRAHDGALHSLAIVDYTLTGLGDILTTVQVGKTGQLFIVDDCAHLIASSVETIDPSGSNTLRHATNSTDRTTRDAAHFILSNNAVPDKLYRLTASGRIYYLTISRFVLDHTTQAYWRIVVLVPLADFTDNTSTVIAAVILVTACVSATVLAAACCLARRLTRRLQAIVHEIDSVVTYVAPEQRRGGSPLEFASLPSPSPRNSPRTRAIAYASAYASATPAGSPPSSARSASSATPFAPPTTSQQAGPPRARAVAAAAHHAQVLGPFEMREIATMRDSVARMKVIIRSFEKYIPDQLLRYLISSNRPAELGLERSMATVMFIDVVGFTTIMEATPVEPLIEQFTEYCNEAIGLIVANHGTLDKMMGDGLMAFFGCPPTPIEDHELWACRCALSLQRRMAELRVQWAEHGQAPFHIRIGLATGPVSVGNVGSASRFQYTVLGDTVNLASRMESLNKHFGTATLITGSTRDGLCRDEFVTRLLGTVRVMGRTHRTRAYELVAALEQFDPNADLHCPVSPLPFHRRPRRGALLPMPMPMPMPMPQQPFDPLVSAPSALSPDASFDTTEGEGEAGPPCESESSESAPPTPPPLVEVEEASSFTLLTGLPSATATASATASSTAVSDLADSAASQSAGGSLLLPRLRMQASNPLNPTLPPSPPSPSSVSSASDGSECRDPTSESPQRPSPPYLPSCFHRTRQACRLFSHAVRLFEGRCFAEAAARMRRYVQTDHVALQLALYEHMVRVHRLRAGLPPPFRTHPALLPLPAPERERGCYGGEREKEGEGDYAEAFLARCEEMAALPEAPSGWSPVLVMTSK